MPAVDLPTEGRRGLLLVLSAPSGAGKTTVAHQLLALHGRLDGRLERSVSMTTRLPTVTLYTPARMGYPVIQLTPSKRRSPLMVTAVVCAIGEWMPDEFDDDRQAAATDCPPSRPAGDQLIAKADATFIRNYDKIQELVAWHHRRLHGHLRQEAMQETLAYTMQLLRKLTRQGDDPVPLLPKVVRFASLRWYDHARFAGNLSAKDLFSRKARRRTSFVTSLPHSTEENEAAAEVRNAMRDRAAGPAELAILKLDYEAFLDSLTPKQREIIESFESGLTLSEIARQRGVSHTAIQDCRKTIARKWTERQGYEDSLGR